MRNRGDAYNQCGRYKESVADDLPHFLIGFECVGRLLQSCRELFFYSENLPFPHFSTSKIQVVIPLQTRGFYNSSMASFRCRQMLSYLSKRKASTTLSYSMLYNSIELSHKMYLIHFQRLNSISTYFRKYIFFIISNNTFFNSTKFTTSCISTN